VGIDGRRALAAALAVVAAIAITALTAGAGVAAAQNPVGAHSMLQLDDPPSFMQAMFAEAAAMHASAIRVDVAPALVFANQSQPPDFSGLDEVMSLAQAYHLRVVADLVTIPTWMADCATPASDTSRCATADLPAYASAVSQIVSHADPVIRDWEVWNEPDTAAFFNGTPQQYAFMLRSARDAIKAVDPGEDVLLGGISGIAGMGWLAQVFATPGADAAHAFDTANVHERGDLWSLASDLAAWRRFLASDGFTGPLWVTEHGYPSDPADQYDPGYTGGEGAQAAYLAASIPTLVDAGAAEVFVTERDNLGGQFASEGVLGGDVSDPPVADPEIVPKPSFAVVQAIAECYEEIGRDCPGARPAASPSAVTMPPVPPGHTSGRQVTVTDPGAQPILLGAATLAGPEAGGLAVEQNGCAGQVLEPRETCVVSLRFRPAAGGEAVGALELASDQGPLDVPVSAAAPSLSVLRSPELPARFTPAGAGDGVGYPQHWILVLTNPLSAGVSIARASLSGPDASRFRIRSDRCAHATLGPRRSCRLTVLFIPTRSGVARAQLTLRGAGLPLTTPLRPVAFSLPTVTRLVPAGTGGCVISAEDPVTAATSQRATVRWTLTRAPASVRRRCGRTSAPAGAVLPGAVVAAGQVMTARRRGRIAGTPGYRAQWHLGGSSTPGPGRYVLTVSATNEHGAGPSRSITVTIPS
jgi:hypothetical protein